MQNRLNEITQFPDRLYNKGHYWQYLAPLFAAHLQNYLNVFEKYRQDIGAIPSEEAWKLLPSGPFATTSDWKWRRQSLSIIQNLFRDKKFDCVLEIGSWNGWLTKHLAINAKTVIATDYFSCPFDGIGNIQTFAENIIAVQCNLEEIKTDYKPGSFDLIVLNHHLAYMSNPVEFLQNLIPLLRPEGIIISLGNTFFKNPEKKRKHNSTFAKRFFDHYGLNLYIQPVKGYMTYADCNFIKGLGFQVKPYQQKFLQNIFSRWNISAPFYTYLIYQQTIGSINL